MYRTYEKIEHIERLLEQAEIEMQEAIERGDEMAQIDIGCEIAELNDRLNFAWQDTYEEDYE